MATRITKEVRWFCTNKELCDEIDARLADLAWAMAHINEYILASGVKDAGLKSISLTHSYSAQIRELKEARGKLWRRSVREVVEDIPDGIEEEKYDTAQGSQESPLAGGLQS
jgi:hypothetical protein